MNKKFLWSITPISIAAVAAPLLTVISCSSTGSYQYASSEAGEFDFLSFKSRLTQEAIRLSPKNELSKQVLKQLLVDFRYDANKDWGIKDIEITTEGNQFVVRYEFVVFKGNLIDFPNAGDVGKMPKDRETLKGVIKVNSMIRN